MPIPARLDPQAALVCVMVLVAAADRGMTDREIGVMAAQVQGLPVFHEFTPERLDAASETAVGLLAETDGLDHAAHLLRAALGPGLRETAYALAAEVVAAEAGTDQPETARMLAWVREALAIDPLAAAAIAHGVRARYRLAG